QNHLQPDAATQGDAHKSPTLQLMPLMPCTAAELSPTSHPGLKVASSGLLRGDVSALGILALRLVDGVDIGNPGGVPDGCSER
nr:hypothetical protein [Tanacetum cinerariifolium]